MPVPRADYPPNWEKLRAAVLLRCSGRCECIGDCGVAHRTLPAIGDGPLGVERRRQAEWDIATSTSDRCLALNGLDHPHTGSKVVLSTAHLCHDSKCDDLLHLKAMCQCCHLNYDRNQHAETRGRNRDKKRGQSRMFDPSKPQRCSMCRGNGVVVSVVNARMNHFKDIPCPKCSLAGASDG